MAIYPKYYFKISLVLFIFSILIAPSCSSQSDEEAIESIIFSINKNVQNAEEEDAKEIIQKWQDYLTSYEYVRGNSPYWSYETLRAPDYPYVSLLLDLITARNNEEVWHCNIIGITAVDADYYVLKSMFTVLDADSKELDLKYITSVYAKKSEDGYLLHSGSAYHKATLENRQIGQVNYVIHPNHVFDESVAKKMDQFNTSIARKFGVEPIAFDYFVANHTDDLSQMMAYDFFSYSYQPERTGGLADNYNSIILSGNNSEYYPHEVVHLYTNAIKSGRKNFMVDEGVATFFGGSSGYTLDWHIQKFKKYLEENPKFRFNELFELDQYIPNGEYMTDFKYVIGGFIIQKIYEQYGMDGLIEVIDIDHDETAYYTMVENKLNVKREDFENYIRSEMTRIKTVDQNILDQMLVTP